MTDRDPPGNARVDVLAEQTRSGNTDAPYLTTAEVAHLLRVKDGWVRQHAADLGAVRLGDGPRPRLRFDRATVSQWVCSCSSGRRSKEGGPPAREPIQRKPRHRPLGSGSQMLPVKPPKPARRAVRDSS